MWNVIIPIAGVSLCEEKVKQVTYRELVIQKNFSCAIKTTLNKKLAVMTFYANTNTIIVYYTT